MNDLASKGRNGDTMLAHITPGEFMVPPAVQTPEVVAVITKAIIEAGGDPKQYIAGENMSINPETGLPEFGFFSKVFKALKSFAPLATAFIPGVGPAISGALGGLGGLGTAIGVGGKILGAISGAKGLFSGGDKQPKIEKQKEVAAAQATPFTPQRPEALSTPKTLNEFAAFSPEQQRSNLATTGLNQGLGGEEDKYYRNLLQRSLIGEGNAVSQNQDSFLLPVESQYFSKKGYDTSNIMKFLEAIRG